MILTGISSMYELEKGYANLDTQANSRGWTRSLVRGRRRFPFQQWYYAYNQSWLGKGCLSPFQSFFLFARLNEAEVLCILEATKPPVCVTTKGLCYKRGQAFMHTCICIGTPMGDLGHMRNLADLGLFTSSPPAQPCSQYCQQASKSGRSEKPRLQISGRIMHAASSRELRAAQSCFRGLSRQPQNTYICRVAVEELGQLSLGIASTRIESLRKDVKAIDHHVRPVCIYCLYIHICMYLQVSSSLSY